MSDQKLTADERSALETECRWCRGRIVTHSLGELQQCDARMQAHVRWHLEQMQQDAERARLVARLGIRR